MTSRQAQKLFFALSVDSLPPEVASQVKDHIDGCPDCQHEWVLVERTLLMLSTASQPVLSSEQSVEMWLSCQHQLDGSEPRHSARRVVKIGTPQTKAAQAAKATLKASTRPPSARSEGRQTDFLAG